MNKEILLAQPRGFCAGVDRTIEIVERTLAQFGATIYVRHEIVHNTYVVNDLRNKGVIFIEELNKVPSGNMAIFFCARSFQSGGSRGCRTRLARVRCDLPAGRQGP